MHKFLTILMLAICLGGCHRSPDSILPAEVELQEGDIVLRRGTGLTSFAVCRADPEGQYSHIGIVVETDSGMMIAHAVPDEPDFRGDPDRVKIERPEKFFGQTKSKLGCVKRCRSHVSAQARHQAAEYAIEAYRRKAPFDHDYNDSDSTALYCCELVERAYRSAGVKLIDAPLHEVDVPCMFKSRCRLPSDFSQSPVLETVAVFKD